MDRMSVGCAALAITVLTGCGDLDCAESGSTDSMCKAKQESSSPASADCVAVDLDAPQDLTGSLENGGPSPCYRFVMNEDGVVSASAIAGPDRLLPDVAVYSDSGDEVFTDSERAGLTSLRSNPLDLPLPKGNYVLVLPTNYADEGNYEVQLSTTYQKYESPATDPGPEPSRGALAIDPSQGPVTLGGYVGSLDPVDTYSLQTSGPSTINVLFDELHVTLAAQVEVTVFVDVNGDGFFSTTDKNQGRLFSPNHSKSFEVAVGAGQHYVRVEMANAFGAASHVITIAARSM